MVDKYKVLCKIGEGAQGIILKAEKKGAPGEYVALKKLRNAADSNGISMDTIREIYMLRELNHVNVINILDIFGKSENLYIIMPYAVGDLEQLIQRKDILLGPADIKQYMVQLFSGVEYIHNKFILHRDLKPSNCLIDSNNRLKISDFGLSREYGSAHRLLSFEACTIWYRSPELLFGADAYSHALDLWSSGCIFAELMLRVPIFGGSNNTEIAQIGRIFRILGTPSNYPTHENDEENHESLYWKDYEMLPRFRKFEPNISFPIDTLLKAQSPNAKHLFLNLCKYDPNRRLSATEALKHKYFHEKPPPTPLELLPNPAQSQSNTNSNNNDIYPCTQSVSV